MNVENFFGKHKIVLIQHEINDRTEYEIDTWHKSKGYWEADGTFKFESLKKAVEFINDYFGKWKQS